MYSIVQVKYINNSQYPVGKLVLIVPSYVQYFDLPWRDSMKILIWQCGTLRLVPFSLSHIRVIMC